MHNYFRTYKDAEEYGEKLKTYYDLLNFAEIQNGNRIIDWRDYSQAKYYIIYDFNLRTLKLEKTYNYKGLNIYTLDWDFLNVAIERIGEEKIINLFK